MPRIILGVLLVLAILGSAPVEAKEASAKTPRLRPVPMPAAEKVTRSIDRGIAFLLARQNKNGSWGGPQRTKYLNVYAPVPGAHYAFRTAVTSLCISALIETGVDRPEVAKSLDRAERWLFEYLPKLRRADATALYNVWGHAFAVQALAHMHGRHRDAATRQRIVAMIKSQFDYLGRYESVDGGWGYYDFRGTKKPASSSMSFVSAAVLVGFHDAKQIGVNPPQKLVDRATASIRRQRKSDFSYLYGEYQKRKPMRGINRPGGSLGRSQACNIALRLWGDEKVTDAVIATWLDRLFARNGWLSIARKRPIPHDSWFQVAGYFYYFGHYYGALCIENVTSDRQEEFQAHMATLMLGLQEKDGSWWDYPLYDYHQQYGTALVLMTLKRCQRPAGSGK
jgi:hypothetical protein